MTLKAGNEKYKAITTAHYRKSAGALLFYDLTDRKSFDHVLEWLNLIYEHTEEGIVVMLVGNKFDLVKDNEEKRAISKKDIEKFCEDH